MAEAVLAERISTRETFRLLGRSLRFVWPYRRQIGVKVALTLVGLSIVLFLPWPLKILIDHVVMGLPVGSSPTPYPPYVGWFVDLLEGMTPFEIVWVIIAVSLLGIVLVGAFGGGVARDNAGGGLSEGLDSATQSENQANASGSRVSGLLGLFEFRYQLRITHRINHGLRTLLFGRLMAWPLTRYSDASVGDAVYRTMYDTPAISRVCYDILVMPAANLFVIGTVIWTTAHSFSAVPSVIVVACLAAPMVLLSTFLMTGVTRRRSLASRLAGAETTATVEEGMSNVVAVQALGAGRRQRAAFAADSRESFKRFRSYMLMTLLLIVVQSVVGVGLVFYVFFDICEAVIVGKMSPGDFAVVYAYFVQLVGNLSGLGSMWFNLQNNVAGMRRVYDVVDAPVDADLQGDDAIERLRQGVDVHHVSYRYPDGTQAVVEASLEGRLGEVVALAGATGAGKSTLAYLLAGFVHPQAGSVRFDGVDARTLSVDCLRAQVAFVFQEAFLFDDTVENNIRMSAPDATHDEVVEAPRALPARLRSSRRCRRASPPAWDGRAARFPSARSNASRSRAAW